ncbi:MAG: hypothetical protein A3G76_06935 [Acidobacteria bacterium RIFCSPLOWO2_12_FULL_65_11]|nr:MAG: hypothetical protein A3H95_12340 [Acidobacteria bacterium RIFCSPLOWO2_02_FULL_64_15]OFW34327.1 MAG: hypothetical protein A3G76_06935 [Acidobacteria bacterium RIFCSPLOWO2_12_FULL_65_11]
MSSDCGVSQGRVFIAGGGDTFQRLPSSKGFLADNEVPRKVLSSTRHCDQDVMIRPIGQSRRQPKIGMSRGEVSPQESRRSSVRKLNRKAV